MNLFGDKFIPKVVESLGESGPLKRDKIKMTDFLNDINNKHGNLLETDSEAHKDMSPYLINRALSQHQDCILWCEEMNRRPNIDKSWFYTYMYMNIRQRKRFSQWNKESSTEDVELIKTYYKYSHNRAVEALEIISRKPGALESIRLKLYKGGT